VCIGLRLEDAETNGERRDSVTAMATPLFQTQPPEHVVPRRDRPSCSREAATGASSRAGRVSASSSTTSNVGGGDRHTVTGGHRPAKSLSSASTQNGQQINAN